MFYKHKHLVFFLGGITVVIYCSLLFWTRMSAANNDDIGKHIAQETKVQGRIICLAEEMHKLYQSDLKADHQHLYGFRTVTGTFYTLLRTNMSEALFVDKRLQEKELMLKGRTFPKTQLLEAIRLYAIHENIVYEIYYYCQICTISALAPQDCECCQEPVKLVEKPTDMKPIRRKK